MKRRFITGIARTCASFLVVATCSWASVDAASAHKSIIPTGTGLGSVTWTPQPDGTMAISGRVQGMQIEAVGKSLQDPHDIYCLCGEMTGTIAGAPITAIVHGAQTEGALKPYGFYYPRVTVHGVYAGLKFSGTVTGVKGTSQERVWRVGGTLAGLKISGTFELLSVYNVHETNVHFHGTIGALHVSGSSSFYYTGFATQQTVH